MSAKPLAADPVRRALEAAIHSLLSDLIRIDGDHPDPEPLSVEAGGWAVTISAGRTGRPEAALCPTDCEADVLEVLASEAFPRPCPWIMGEMNRRNMLHGETTVKRALARMVDRKWVTASRRAPRGYTITELGRSRIRSTLRVNPSRD